MNQPAAESPHLSAAPAQVWVTRDELPDGPLCRAIRAEGLDPICEPVLSRHLVVDVGEMVARLGAHDWLVLASEFAIEAVQPSQVRCRLAVIGAGSRSHAESRGLVVELVSPDSTGEGLWRELRTRVAPGERVCYPRSSLAKPPGLIPGVIIESPVLYETRARPIDPTRVRACAVAAVTSASAAAEVARGMPKIRCAAIGPSTAASLQTAGIEPWLVCVEPGFASLARAIASGLRAPGKP